MRKDGSILDAARCNHLSGSRDERGWTFDDENIGRSLLQEEVRSCRMARDSEKSTNEASFGIALADILISQLIVAKKIWPVAVSVSFTSLYTLILKLPLSTLYISTQIFVTC